MSSNTNIPQDDNPMSSPDEPTASKVEWSAESVEKIRSIRSESEMAYILMDIRSLARNELPAAIAILPEVLEKRGLSAKMYDELSKVLTVDVVRDAAVSALIRIIAGDANYSLRGSSSWAPQWYQLCSGMNSLIQAAELKTSSRRTEIVQALKKLLIDSYRFGHEQGPPDIRQLLRGLGENVSPDYVSAEIEAELRHAMKTAVEGTDNYREPLRNEILDLAMGLREIPEDLKALALQLYPKFTGNTEDAKEFIGIFSLPRETVLGEGIRITGETLKQAAKEPKYASPTLYWLKKHLSTLAIPLSAVEAELVAALDRFIDLGELKLINPIFIELGLSTSYLEQEPRRAKMKALFITELQKFCLRDKKDDPDYDLRIDATDLNPLSSWDSLDIPVLKEVVDDELRSAVQDDKHDHGEHVRRFRENVALPRNYVPSSETAEAIRIWCITELSGGFTHNAGFVELCGFNLQEPDFQRAVLQGLIKEISSEHHWFGSQEDTLWKARDTMRELKMPEDALQKSEVRDALRGRMMTDLENGNMEPARSIRDEMSFTEEWKSQAAKTAARKGFAKLFLERYTSPEQSFEFAREMNVSDADMATVIEGSMLNGPEITLRALDIIPQKVRQNLDEKFHLQKYAEKLNVPSVEIYAKFCSLVDTHNGLGFSAYVAQVKGQLESLVSGKRQDPDIVHQPHYRELVSIVYPNHSEGHTNFERNEVCEDRTDELARYVVRDNYNFTVSPGSDMQLKNGQEKNEDGLASLNAPITKAQNLFASTDFDRQKMFETFDHALENDSKKLVPLEAFQTREEKIFGLMLEKMAGRFHEDRFKELLIAYQYAEFENIREYIEGTRGRAEKSRNPQYAYLLELREFFADRLKDVARRITDRALQNPVLQSRFSGYFRELSQREQSRVTNDVLNKMQVDKLGISPGFLKQIARTLKVQSGVDYSEEQIRDLIREYEDRTAGMSEPAPEFGDIDPAVFGQIRAQRTKSVRALERLSGTSVHPSQIHLEDMNLQEYLNQRRSLASGDYNEETFESYLTHSFTDVFSNELGILDDEIIKYEPKDAERKHAKAKRVEAFISMNHTSAHARAVAGVCVAGDNPIPDEDNNIPENQWQMPNYFQMVLRDAETKLCKGCILLHAEKEGDKTYLTASMNPSSTFLYQVNEEEMFNAIRAQLITFAKENNFDGVGVSKISTIRTNRTGGLFERAMDASIHATRQEIVFEKPRKFSFSPSYEQEGIDLIWVNDKTVTESSPESSAP